MLFNNQPKTGSGQVTVVMRCILSNVYKHLKSTILRPYFNVDKHNSMTLFISLLIVKTTNYWNNIYNRNDLSNIKNVYMSTWSNYNHNKYQNVNKSNLKIFQTLQYTLSSFLFHTCTLQIFNRTTVLLPMFQI